MGEKNRNNNQGDSDLPLNVEKESNVEWQKRAELLVLEKINADRRTRKLETEVKDLLKTIKAERNKRQIKERELKLEIKAIEMQLNRLTEENNALKQSINKAGLGNSISINTEETDEIVQELDEEMEVLRNLDPRYWDPIKAMLPDKPITIPLLKCLLEKKEVKLIILAMMLMTDHVTCLEILEELRVHGIVTIEYAQEGDLNPRIHLVNNLG